LAEQPGRTGWRNAERARISPTEQRLRLVTPGYVNEIPRQQPVLMKRGGVALEPALVLKPAFDEVEGDLRQSPLRHAVEVFDIDGSIEVTGRRGRDVARSRRRTVRG